MTDPLTTRRLRRLPALDPSIAPARPSISQIRERERKRPGFAFSVHDLCLLLNESLARQCQDPQLVLLELARMALPPHHWSAVPSSASVQEMIVELVDHQHRTLRWELSRLAVLVDWLADRHNRSDLRSLRCGWEIFHDRLLEHLHDEETDCFPLCLVLSEAGSQHEGLPTSGDCMLRLASMGETHKQALAELDEMLVLAQRADLSFISPEAGAVVRGIDAMRSALSVHTDIEGGLLLPRCLKLAFSFYEQARLPG